MDNKQQIQEIKELLNDLAKYEDNAEPREFVLLVITEAMLKKTIEWLEESNENVVDDDVYRAMFSSVYTVIKDDRAYEYKRKKTYLA